MKLLKLNNYYSTYIDQFYSKNKNLKNKSYQVQKESILNDAFSWGDAWTFYLKQHGYITDEIIINANYMQRKWLEEQNVKNYNSLPLQDAAIMQVKKFNPDILWYDSADEILLSRLKESVPSIKLIIGWVGSAIAKSNVWKMVDLILTCAPESVDILKRDGLKAYHINHGFDPRILNKLNNPSRLNDIIFIGHLIRKSEFHNIREKMLEEIASSINLKIFSPAKEEHNFNNLSRILIRRNMSNIVKLLQKMSINDNIINKIPKLKNVLKWDALPEFPDQINKKLKHHIYAGVYGIDMFQEIKKAKITLNIHADTSPKYASNMRLFETTGVGGLLLTEKKDNIQTLFETDKEIVTYNSTEECLEKINWLLEHEAERAKIALAGQIKTLKVHTFEKRAEKINDIIKKELKYGKK